MAEHVSVTAEIDAPIDEVWETIMDPHRLDEWVTIHREVSGVPANGLEEGSGFEQKLSRLSVSFRVQWEIVELDRPRFARWKGSGPAGTSATICYELSELAEGRTRFLYTNQFGLPGGGAGKLAAKAFGASAARREARKSLDNLCELLEDG